MIARNDKSGNTDGYEHDSICNLSNEGDATMLDCNCLSTATDKNWEDLHEELSRCFGLWRMKADYDAGKT